LHCAADILAMKITLDLAVMNDHGSTLLGVQVANSLSGRNKPADALTLSQPFKALADVLNHKEERCL